MKPLNLIPAPFGDNEFSIVKGWHGVVSLMLTVLESPHAESSAKSTAREQILSLATAVDTLNAQSDTYLYCAATQDIESQCGDREKVGTGKTEEDAMADLRKRIEDDLDGDIIHLDNRSLVLDMGETTIASDVRVVVGTDLIPTSEKDTLRTHYIHAAISTVDPSTNVGVRSR